ncbi:MAG: glutathione peroxidase [Saccharofermentanales bacterium]
MNIYDFTVRDIFKKEVPLSDYKGKVLLIVNTATGCGFTPQYEGLEKLYEKYKGQGFDLLDFPCNQFLGQAPGTDAEIVSFCQLKFGTTFKTFSKIEVNGKNADPLFTFLKDNAPTSIEKPGEGGVKKKFRDLTNNLIGNSIKWNFTKFLVGRDGEVLERFEPTFTPEEIDPYIAEALK